jgi:hypothetical protein
MAKPVWSLSDVDKQLFYFIWYVGNQPCVLLLFSLKGKTAVPEPGKEVQY